MRISRKGIELIKSFESFSSVPYFCQAGRKTIGYGHIIRSGENLNKITKAYGFELLKRDILKSEKSVIRNITAYLNNDQFDALVSFTYNVGAAALQRSSLRSKINSYSDDYIIYNEFTRWIYASGRKSKGLIIRRKIEANLFIGNYK